MPSDLGFEAMLPLTFDAAIERVTEALKADGFGVLTRIDVHDTLKKKIGAECRPYVILGACNPQLAYKALSAQSDVRLMLPCNVTVESAGDGRSQNNNYTLLELRVLFILSYALTISP